MRQSLRVVGICVIGCLATIAFPQTVTKPLTKGQKTNCPTDSAKDVVQSLWNMAASGETVTHWGAVARFFSEPRPWPSDGSVRVFSDYWWVEYRECSDQPEAAVIVYSHWDRTPGLIDSQLKFTPPPQSSAQAGFVYRVVMAAPQIYYRGRDGKPVPGKATPETKRWLIEGPPAPPFLTVTAAIRYVLEKRSDTTDPITKKNADETLAQLLKMH
jgi:hypothetical protein